MALVERVSADPLKGVVQPEIGTRAFRQAVNLKKSVIEMTQPTNILPLNPSPDADTPAAKPEAVPAETWAALQAAGHAAAERLRDLIEAQSFTRLKPSDQARLIQLALDRAYGPPVKREMTLSLSGSVSDAVAESLGRLAAQDLPEMRKADR